MKSSIKRLVGHVACRGEKRNACKLSVGKTAGKSALERHKCRQEKHNQTDSIKCG
jgi:hypothetical protein